MEGDFRKPPLTYSADEIDACQILLQLPVLVSESDSRLNCFGFNWGFKRRRSNPLPNSIKDKVRDPATQVSSSSPGEFQENLKKKREYEDVKHESERMKAFNLGLKAMKQDNHISPLGIHNIPFDLLAQEFDLNEANRILDKTMAAQAGRTRIKICRAKNSSAASRQCYPILTLDSMIRTFICSFCFLSFLLPIHLSVHGPCNPALFLNQSIPREAQDLLRNRDHLPDRGCE